MLQQYPPPLISPQGCVPQLVSYFQYIHGVITGVSIAFALGIVLIFLCALLAMFIIAVIVLIGSMLYCCCLCIAKCCCKDDESNEITDLLESQETN